MKIPHYYTPNKDVIARMPEEDRIGFIRGNIIKYFTRAGLKDDFNQDFAKGMHYAKMLLDLQATEK